MRCQTIGKATGYETDDTHDESTRSQNDPSLHGRKVKDELYHQRYQEVGTHESRVVEKYHYGGQHKWHITVEPQGDNWMHDLQFRPNKQPEKDAADAKQPENVPGIPA